MESPLSTGRDSSVVEGSAIPATQVSRGVEGDLQGNVIVREQGFAEVAHQEVEEVRIHTPEDTDASETESLEGELASKVRADEIPDVAPEEPEMRIPHMRGIAIAFRSLDDVNLENVFTFRPCLMKSVPRFMRGPFRNCVRVALDEIIQGHSAHDVLRQTRGWKLFHMLPLLLSRPPRGRAVSREKVFDRFSRFSQGEWLGLIKEGRVLSEQSASASRRQRRRQQLNDVERRAIRAQHLVLLGELSSARQALEGADLAPPTDQTLSSLRTRPTRPRAPLPLEIFHFRPASPLQLDEDVFAKNIRSSKRGVAGRPSGMTFNHLRPMLESPSDIHVLFLVAEILARAEVLDEIVAASGWGG